MRLPIVLIIAMRDLKEILRDLFASIGLLGLFGGIVLAAAIFALASQDGSDWEVLVVESPEFMSFIASANDNSEDSEKTESSEKKSNSETLTAPALLSEVNSPTGRIKYIHSSTLTQEQMENETRENNRLIMTPHMIENMPAFQVHFARPIPEHILFTLQRDARSWRQEALVSKLAKSGYLKRHVVEEAIAEYSAALPLRQLYVGRNAELDEAFEEKLNQLPGITEELKTFILEQIPRLQGVWAWLTAAAAAMVLMLSQTIGGMLFDYKSRKLLDVLLIRVSIDELIFGSALYFLGLFFLTSSVIISSIYQVAPPLFEFADFSVRFTVWLILIGLHAVAIIWFYSGAILKCDTLRQALIVFSIFSSVLLFLVSMSTPYVLPREATLMTPLLWFPIGGAFVFSGLLLTTEVDPTMMATMLLYHISMGAALLYASRRFVHYIAGRL